MTISEDEDNVFPIERFRYKVNQLGILLGPGNVRVYLKYMHIQKHIHVRICPMVIVDLA